MGPVAGGSRQPPAGGLRDALGPARGDAGAACDRGGRNGDARDAVLRDWECGGPKLYLTWRALELRREYPRLFAEGDYTPLLAAGERAEHTVAYARRQGEVAVLVVAGQLFGQLVAEPGDLPLGADIWADTSIPTGTLPEGTRPLNVLTGRSVEVVDGRLLMADVFADFPAALLFCEGTPE